MTTQPSKIARARFLALEQPDFQRLEHAGYLKGLLQPFKGKGSLEVWASQCQALRDNLATLAHGRVLSQARAHPFNLLEVYLAHQSTSAGTTFLRWRNLDRSAMGVALWERLIADRTTPSSLIDDLYAMERQRVVLNMQMSAVHTLARQALDCADKLARAETTYMRRVQGQAATNNERKD